MEILNLTSIKLCMVSLLGFENPLCSSYVPSLLFNLAYFFFID